MKHKQIDYYHTDTTLCFQEIYPSKACLQETAKQCHGCMQARILSIDHEIGQGMGSRIRKSQF